jgi:hypothetical protein
MARKDCYSKPLCQPPSPQAPVLKVPFDTAAQLRVPTALVDNGIDDYHINSLPPPN